MILPVIMQDAFDALRCMGSRIQSHIAISCMFRLANDVTTSEAN